MDRILNFEKKKSKQLLVITGIQEYTKAMVTHTLHRKAFKTYLSQHPSRSRDQALVLIC